MRLTLWFRRHDFQELGLFVAWGLTCRSTARSSRTASLGKHDDPFFLDRVISHHVSALVLVVDAQVSRALASVEGSQCVPACFLACLSRQTR